MNQRYISGMGKDSVVPDEIKGWSWGAFLMNWIWGIGNSTFRALLVFVPFVGLVMIFVLGAKGNEWAWRNRTWRDVEHFKSTQKKWRNAGIILVLVIMPMIIFLIINMMKGEAYDLSVEAVNANSEVVSIVGPNPSPGFFVLGNVSTDGVHGEANLNYSIEGSNSEAEVYVYATSNAGKWELKEVLVINQETGERAVVVTRAK